jgi:hypothetical protein
MHLMSSRSVAGLVFAYIGKRMKEASDCSGSLFHKYPLVIQHNCSKICYK